MGCSLQLVGAVPAAPSLSCQLVSRWQQLCRTPVSCRHGEQLPAVLYSLSSLLCQLVSRWQNTVQSTKAVTVNTSWWSDDSVEFLLRALNVKVNIILLLSALNVKVKIVKILFLPSVLDVKVKIATLRSSQC